jgi:hypothetical protein
VLADALAELEVLVEHCAECQWDGLESVTREKTGHGSYVYLEVDVGGGWGNGGIGRWIS